MDITLQAMQREKIRHIDIICIHTDQFIIALVTRDNRLFDSNERDKTFATETYSVDGCTNVQSSKMLRDNSVPKGPSIRRRRRHLIEPKQYASLSDYLMLLMLLLVVVVSIYLPMKQLVEYSYFDIVHPNRLLRDS